jgi:uncharacterized membrane protein YhaH (DUF805 family)
MNNRTREILSYLFSFDGCVGRLGWWGFEICWMAFVFVLVEINGGKGDFNTLSTILLVASFWPKLAVMIKRWHDRGKSGYWVFISLIPVVGPFWVLFELGFLGPTDDHSNQYYRGLDPWAPIPKIVPKIVSNPGEK